MTMPVLVAISLTLALIPNFAAANDPEAAAAVDAGNFAFQSGQCVASTFLASDQFNQAEDLAYDDGMPIQFYSLGRGQNQILITNFDGQVRLWKLPIPSSEGRSPNAAVALDEKHGVIFQTPEDLPDVYAAVDLDTEPAALAEVQGLAFFEEVKLDTPEGKIELSLILREAGKDLTAESVAGFRDEALVFACACRSLATDPSLGVSELPLTEGQKQLCGELAPAAYPSEVEAIESGIISELVGADPANCENCRATVGEKQVNGRGICGGDENAELRMMAFCDPATQDFPNPYAALRIKSGTPACRAYLMKFAADKFGNITETFRVRMEALAAGGMNEAQIAETEQMSLALAIGSSIYALDEQSCFKFDFFGNEMNQLGMAMLELIAAEGKQVVWDEVNKASNEVLYCKAVNENPCTQVGGELRDGVCKAKGVEVDASCTNGDPELGSKLFGQIAKAKRKCGEAGIKTRKVSCAADALAATGTVNVAAQGGWDKLMACRAPKPKPSPTTTPSPSTLPMKKGPLLETSSKDFLAQACQYVFDGENAFGSCGVQAGGRTIVIHNSCLEELRTDIDRAFETLKLQNPNEVKKELYWDESAKKLAAHNQAALGKAVQNWKTKCESEGKELAVSRINCTGSWWSDRSLNEGDTLYIQGGLKRIFETSGWSNYCK